VRRDHLFPVSRAAQFRPPEVGRQHGTVPAFALLHNWLCATYIPWKPTVPCPHCPGTGAADVRRQEHDGSVRPQTRPILDGS